jgi:hypothetical protein
VCEIVDIAAASGKLVWKRGDGWVQYNPHVAILVMKSGRNLNRKKRRKRMNEENRMITIDGKEYDFEELEDNQKSMVNQVLNLKASIAQARFDYGSTNVAAGCLQQDADC